MNLQSFQLDTEMKLYRQVNDSMGQVLNRLIIKRHHRPRGLNNRRLITRNSLNLNMRLCSSLNEIAVDEILSRYGSGGPMSFNELRKQLFLSFFNSFAD